MGSTCCSRREIPDMEIRAGEMGGKMKRNSDMDNDIEHRWFWNISDTVSLTQKEDYWAQYSLDMCSKIEESFQQRIPQLEIDDKYLIKFNYVTNQHIQKEINNCNTTQERKVIREIPRYVQNTLRVERIVRENETFKPYYNNYIDNIELFCYARIFRAFHIDESDQFIGKFILHTALLHTKIANFLEKAYVNYLKEVHDLEIFNFDKLKDMLSRDLKDQKSRTNSYVDYYVKHLTPDNFCRQIAKMYTEEGQLYQMLNRVIRFMQFDQHMEYALYFLCLLFTYEHRDQKMDKDITVFRGNEMEDAAYAQLKAVYAPGNVIINYNFMSTSRAINEAKKFMDKRSLPYKVLFEILIEKESSLFPFLSFKPFDVAKISTFPGEEEVILPPNGVFIVQTFEEGAYTTIKMEYRTNLFPDSISFIEKDNIGNRFGIYQPKNMKEEYYIQIFSVKHNNVNESFDFQVLSKMTNLRYLNFAHYGMGVQGINLLVEQFKKLPYLEELDLSYNRLEDEEINILSAHLSYLALLKFLNLDYNNLGPQGMKNFAEQMHYLSNLEHLNMNYNPIEDEGIATFSENLINLGHLQHLDMMSIEIEDKGMKAFAVNLIHLPCLLKLDISLNKYGDEGMKELGEQMFHLAGLQHLKHKYNEISVEGMKLFTSSFKHLNNLQILEMGCNIMKEEGMKIFAVKLVHLAHLQVLGLGGNLIGPEGMKDLVSQLIHLPFLRCLELDSNLLGDEGISIFAEQLINLPQLQEITLSHNQITDSGVNTLTAHLYHLTNLQLLNLHNNPIGEEAKNKILQLLKSFDPSWAFETEAYKCERHTTKKELFTGQFAEKFKLFQQDSLRLTKDQLMCISSFEYYQNVKSIDFSGCTIGIDGITHFANQIVYLKNLQELNLRENELGDYGMQVFSAQSIQLYHLQVLKLNSNKIGDEGLQSLAINFTHLSRLQWLDFGDNLITGEGMKTFAEHLHQLSNLQHLGLYGNPFGDDGLKALAAHFNNLGNLQELIIFSNQIGDEGIQIFAEQMIHLKNIHKLYLGGELVSNKGLKSFTEHLPNLNKLKEFILVLEEVGDEEVKAFAAQLINLPILQNFGFIRGMNEYKPVSERLKEFIFTPLEFMANPRNRTKIFFKLD